MFFKPKPGPLERAASLLAQLVHKGNDMTNAIKDLQAAVAAQTAVINSAITLLNGLTATIADANAISPAAVEAAVTDIQNETAQLAAAVAANTFAAPAPTPTPAPAPAPAAGGSAPPATPAA
jgi:hypothetical protein